MDNVPSHTALLTLQHLRNSGWTSLPHPPYSLDLAPNDFWLYMRVKRGLRAEDSEIWMSWRTSSMRRLWASWLMSTTHACWSNGLPDGQNASDTRGTILRACHEVSVLRGCLCYCFEWWNDSIHCCQNKSTLYCSQEVQKGICSARTECF